MNLYHISEKNLDNAILYPRIPSNYMTKNGYEDNKTPRISFAKTIDGALMGISMRVAGKKLYIHIPDNDKQYIIKNITNKQVPDSSITGEAWITVPVKLKCIGQLEIIGDANEDGITYKYGDNKAELYKWKWKMIPLTKSVEGTMKMNIEKVEYNSIFETYINNEIELDEITSMNYAMEAEENILMNKDSDERNIDSSNALFTKIAALIEKIIEYIENLLISLKNKFQQLMVTDKGFSKELATAERDRKPLNAIKVINYQYIPEFLSTQYGKIRTMANKLVSKATSAATMDPNSPLLLDNGEFEISMLKEIAYTEGKSFKEYLDYVKKTFRGEKKEVTILKSQIPLYKKNIDNYKSLYKTLNTDIIDLKGNITNLKNKTKLSIRNPNSKEIDKKKITMQIRNLTNLYNFFLSYINLYHELTVEIMLSSRVIVGKFYQMQR